MKWFRLYTEIRRDPKLRRLPVSYRWVWVTILCIARESPRPGWLLLRKDMPAQPADIADEANVPQDDAVHAIELFKSGSYEMLAEEDRVLRVVNWGKRQYENDSSAARMRRYRERQNRQNPDGNVGYRHRDGSCDVTGDVTKSSPFSVYTPPHQECGESPRNEVDRNSDPALLTPSEKDIFHGCLQKSSSEQRSCDGCGDGHCEVTRDGGSDVTGDVTLQSYRSNVSNIQITGISVSTLSASEAAQESVIAPGPFPPSAPDGAACADVLVVNDSVFSTKRSSPPERDSIAVTTRTVAEQPASHLARASPHDATISDPHEGKALSPNSLPTGPSENYLTKRRRKLSGWKLEAFEEFWQTFGYKKGRAEAADAWLDISDLTPELARKIIQAADREAEARALLVAKGRTPKWAQGWISARRWEDWEDDRAATFNHDHAPTREATHDARGSRTQEDEDAEYYRSIREAVKRFM